MQESSGTRQEKFSVLMCCKGLPLHRERSPSDPRLDTCTGSPKGARLVPREIDLLQKKKKKITPSFFLSPLLFFKKKIISCTLPTRTLFHAQLLWKRTRRRGRRKKKKKGTRINDCLLHWRLMIHWCLSVLALKVEKSFDDGGLRLTDKSWMPPSSPSNTTTTTLLHPRCSPSLTLLSYVLHCYRYGNPLLFYFIFGTEKFKLKAEEPCAHPGCLFLRLCSSASLVCLLSPSRSLSVWICSSHRMHFRNTVACY